MSIPATSDANVFGQDTTITSTPQDTLGPSDLNTGVDTTAAQGDTTGTWGDTTTMETSTNQ